MPWEHIGDCGDGQMPEDRAWILFCLEFAIDYLQFTIGEPDGCELGIMWHDHELGSYPSIGVQWENSDAVAPWEYVWRWQSALDRLEREVAWHQISPRELHRRLEVEAEERCINEADR